MSLALYKQIENAIEQLLQQMGYRLVGTLENVISKCEFGGVSLLGVPQPAEIKIDQIILERPLVGSYFLIIDFQWATAINTQTPGPCSAPPLTPPLGYYTKKELRVEGIRNISSQLQQTETLIEIKKECDLNLYECNCGNYDSFKVFVGNDYYVPYPTVLPLLVSKQFDAIKLYADVYSYFNGSPPICILPGADCSSCLFQDVAEAYLSIPQIKIYYRNTETYLQELSLILTLLSFVLGVIG